MKTIQLTTFTAALVFAVSCWGTAPTNESVTIWSDGTRLAGNLWKPADLGENDKRPAVLMVHGWGGMKQHLNQAYAPQFAQLGFVVLTFDYRGWGESEGKYVRVGEAGKANADGVKQMTVTEVREIVDPLDQLGDIRAALAFLMGEPQVDADTLAIWGSSLGGGLALQTAAEFPQIKVLITQVGAVNMQLGTEAEGAWQWRVASARGQQSPFPTAEMAAPGLRGVPDWERFLRYDPFASTPSLNAATLIIDAEDEELFDRHQNGALLHETIKDRLVSEYHTVSGKHYDVYSGAGYAKAIKLESDWLGKHLKPAK